MDKKTNLEQRKRNWGGERETDSRIRESRSAGM